jgi:plastocyanin
MPGFAQSVRVFGLALPAGPIVGLVVGLSSVPAGAAIPVVDNCQEANYVDRSATGADRSLIWDFNIRTDVERCLKIKVGQSVEWVGDLGFHPLDPHEGDTPNPIASPSSGMVRFNTPGVFGYHCRIHPSQMFGAVWVVADTPRVPVLGSSWGWALCLTGLLGATGWVVARKASLRTR